MAGKTKALMEAMSQQLLRFIEGVRQEGGVRRAAFEFPDNPVVVMVIRRADYEDMGMPESAKGQHRYEKQTVVEARCGWCGQKEEHPVHGASLPLP